MVITALQSAHQPTHTPCCKPSLLLHAPQSPWLHT